MGERTGILAFGDDIPARLRSRPVADIDRTKEFVEMIHPGYLVEPIGGTALRYATYPPDDVVFASSSADLDIICDRRLTFDNPATLPEHLQRIGSGRRIATLGTHSVVDWLSCAAWSDGVLVRSLTVSPDGGIIENIGEPLPFETPYWAGEHPVVSTGEDPYPLPFHPLDLGQAAQRHLFGFVTDGPSHPDDVPTGEVHLLGFRVTDPTGEEKEKRESWPRCSARSWDNHRLNSDAIRHIPFEDSPATPALERPRCAVHFSGPGNQRDLPAQASVARRPGPAHRRRRRRQLDLTASRSCVRRAIPCSRSPDATGTHCPKASRSRPGVQQLDEP